METHLAKQLNALYKQTPSFSTHLPPLPNASLQNPTDQIPSK